ncbi:MAG TPA: peptidoglycan editing factor PgeF, partial [Rhodanobacter sp.]|nr:peptidoglycan editing factor PgeF [Rhodanobacter sp.]
LRDALGLPAAPRWLHQVHGREVIEQGVAPPAGEPDADAAVTRTPGVALAILTADCLPVLLAADDGSVVGAAHAGWRGLAAGVLESTLHAMRCAPDRVVAWLGPCIGGPSYEVGEEVRAAFVDHAPDAARCFAPTRPGHWRCDLAALARQRLAAAGVTSVHGGGFDTFTDPRFYSYRREGARSGRFASLVWMAGG